jgi:hypothetical protein
MAPQSQAHQLVRDFSQLPETPPPETWGTSVPVDQPAPPPERSLAPEIGYGLSPY